jgi:hypothetical protein
LRSAESKLAIRIRTELRHKGDRAAAARMVKKQAASREAIELIRIDLWFDLRNILSDKQLEALDQDLELRSLEAPLRSKRSAGSASSWTGAASTGVPLRLTRSDIKRGIRRIRSRVTSCGLRYTFTGKVSVKIKIAPSGRVSSATGYGGNFQMRSCVSRVLRAARFRKTKHGMSVKYPFVFR